MQIINEEPTREAVVEFLTHWYGWGWSNKDARLLNKAIEYIQQAPKYRKKAKRWKRKYMSLREGVEKTRAEIEKEISKADAEAKQTPDGIGIIACGVGAGLQIALDIFDKYRESEPKGMIIPKDNLCNSCTNIGCEFQSGIVRTKCAFYMPPHIKKEGSDKA